MKGKLGAVAIALLLGGLPRPDFVLYERATEKDRQIAEQQRVIAALELRLDRSWPRSSSRTFAWTRSRRTPTAVRPGDDAHLRAVRARHGDGLAAKDDDVLAGRGVLHRRPRRRVQAQAGRRGRRPARQEPSLLPSRVRRSAEAGRRGAAYRCQGGARRSRSEEIPDGSRCHADHGARRVREADLDALLDLTRTTRRRRPRRASGWRRERRSTREQCAGKSTR